MYKCVNLLQITKVRCGQGKPNKLYLMNPKITKDGVYEIENQEEIYDEPLCDTDVRKSDTNDTELSNTELSNTEFNETELSDTTIKPPYTYMVA